MPSNVANALTFIINAVAQLYLFALLLRLLLPWLGADFRNPIAQAVLKVTSPVVMPLRRIIPPIGRIDTATVLVAFIIQYVTIVVLLMIMGILQLASVAAIAITTVINLLVLVLNLFVFAIVIRVVLSWVAPGGYNPAIAIIHTLTDRVLLPFRRVIPPLGGLDLSPLIAIILLSALKIVVAGLKLLPV